MPVRFATAGPMARRLRWQRRGGICVRDGGWYQLGFLIGAGSPVLGMFGRRPAKAC